MALIYSPAYIVNQIDERTFQASLCGTDSIVTCYLSPELYYQDIRPLVGDLVKLEYNFGLRRAKARVQTIVDILYSKKKQDRFKEMITEGLRKLRQWKHNYASFRITSFFGSNLGELLYSTLGFRTVRDLVNVEAVILVETVAEYSYIEKEEFYELFEDLLDFFEQKGLSKKGL